MIRTIAAILIAASAAPAAAQDMTRGDRAIGFTGFRWVVENCPHKRMPDLAILGAAIIQSDLTEAEIEKAGKLMAEAVRRKFGSDTAAACDELHKIFMAE